MNYYRLQIDTNTDSKEIFDKVTEILERHPSIAETDFNYRYWQYGVEVNDTDPYYDFINNFLEIVVPKIAALAKLGISRNDISFWLLYEYDQQCNMEFHPEQMKRLGDNGIALCISCWQR